MAISGKDIHFVRRNYGNYVAKQKNFYSISSDPLTSNQIAIYTLDGQKNLDTARGGNIGSRGDRIFKTNVFEGDFYSKETPYASGDTIASIQSSTQDDISGYIQIGNFLNAPVVDAAKKRSTYTHLFEGGSPIISPKQVKDVGTTAKVDLTPLQRMSPSLGKKIWEKDRYNFEEPYPLSGNASGVFVDGDAMLLEDPK